MSRSRVNPPSPPVREGVLQCDGTAKDYRRHSHRGEVPCDASREAWRIQCRLYRFTGIYDTSKVEEPSQLHPFFYRKPKRNQQKRDGVYLGTNKRKTRCPKCGWMGKHHRDCENK